MQHPGYFRRRSERTSDAPGADSRSDRFLKTAHQVLLIASLIANGVLGWLAHTSANRLSNAEQEKVALEATKVRLESQLLQAQSSPNIIFSHVTYELSTFQAQLREKALVPFLSNVKDYRILDSAILADVERDLKLGASSKIRNGAVTFLVIANLGTVSAHTLQITQSDSKVLQLGDLQANAAILIPTRYGIAGQSPDPLASSFSSLQYNASGSESSPAVAMKVPAPVAQAWTPVLANVRAIGRAMADDDSHLSDVLPSAKD